MDTFLADDFGLVHLFHRIDSLCLFKLYAPYFTEASLTNYILTIKILSIHLFALEIYIADDLFFGLEFG